MSEEGNGGGYRRRRADRPSRTDKAVKGCLTQALLISSLGLVTLVSTVYRWARNA